MIRFIEAIPITIFLTCIRSIDTQVPGNFIPPFVISSVAAVILIFFFMYKKMTLNRLFLGINLYLISGGLAFITHQYWLNNIYDQMQASGVILWIIVVGGSATIFSPGGFVGAVSSDTNTNKKYSVLLLLCTFIAFTVSLILRNNKLFPEFIPFLCLFLLQDYLKDKLAAAQQKHGAGMKNKDDAEMKKSNM